MTSSDTGPVAGAAPRAAATPVSTGWQGRLELRYRSVVGRTVPFDRHEGPLRVLKALHPEGPAICHHVLVHPPGGIVGGDMLDIDVALGPQTHALITTPGATRFYRSAGTTAAQHLDARLEAGARLEWLPMETIAHPGTRARNAMRFALAPGAEMIGWDLLSLGLPSAGERFEAGVYEQSLSLLPDWLERGILDASDPVSQRLLSSPLGFDGHSCLATLWCAAGSDWPAERREALLETARQAFEEAGGTLPGGVTAPTGRVIVLRALAHRIEPLWTLARAVRRALRATLWGLEASPPRIWSN